MVLDLLDQLADGLLAKIRIVCRALLIERVRLIDKQDSAEGRPDCQIDFGRGLPDVLADQVAPPALDKNTAVRDDAQRLVDFCDQPCDRCFAGSGVSGKDHVLGADLPERRDAGLLRVFARLHDGDLLPELLLDGP